MSQPSAPSPAVSPAELEARLRLHLLPELGPRRFRKLLGAFASEMWLLAFAIESPARVRTLALVEILIAGLISRRLFAQTPGLAEAAGMALVCAGIVLLFQG